jgi:protein HIRA/HIR1
VRTTDIIDIAWARDDTKMASVGLDKLVLIWNGQSFGESTRIWTHSYRPELKCDREDKTD